MLGCNIFLSFFFLLAEEFPKETSPMQEQSLISQQETDQLEEPSAAEQKEQNVKDIPKLLFFIFGFSGVMISFVYG